MGVVDPLGPDCSVLYDSSLADAAAAISAHRANNFDIGRWNHPRLPAIPQGRAGVPPAVVGRPARRLETFTVNANPAPLYKSGFHGVVLDVLNLSLKLFAVPDRAIEVILLPEISLPIKQPIRFFGSKRFPRMKNAIDGLIHI